MNGWQILFTVIGVIYFLIAYILLFPALGYCFERHNGIQKSLQILAYLLAPVLFPFGIAASMALAFLVFLFFVLVFPFYWLRVHLPFGGIFKAWYKLSLRILERLRKALEALLGFSFCEGEQDAPQGHSSASGSFLRPGSGDGPLPWP